MIQRRRSEHGGRDQAKRVARGTRAAVPRCRERLERRQRQAAEGARKQAALYQAGHVTLHLLKLKAALTEYYGRAAQASNRVSAIQRVVKTKLEGRFSGLGPLGEVRLEQAIKGKHRPKNWDARFPTLRLHCL